jgi:hypothetical protein
MRILHTILSSGFAGTERATAEMCNALCDGHEVMLVVRRGHRGHGGASIIDHLDPRVQVREVGLALGNGHVDVLGPVQQQATRAGIRDERVGVGDGVPLGHILGPATHEGVDGTVTEALATPERQACDGGVKYDEVECCGMWIRARGVLR